MSQISIKTRQKGYWIYKQGKVKKIMENEKRVHFNVESGSKTHSIILDKMEKEWKCDCEFYALKFKDCSHIIACREFSKSEEIDKKRTLLPNMQKICK